MTSLDWISLVTVKHSVDLGRHDEIVLVQPFYLLGAQETVA
jgi:hypothetical protein